MNVRNYEAFYIVAANHTDDECQKIADHFKEVVEKNGGTVESAAKWKKRKLAYEVKGHREGNYILMHFSGPSSVPAELNRLMNISDDIIRHRIYIRENVTA
jgi:small subunit ribosomal protein S6